MGETKKFSGVVTADQIEVRFAYSGKVAKVYKHPGDSVKIGDWLASLSKKEPQAQLDQELADYERIRAEFEIFVASHANPGSDREKYEKVQAQAVLNAAVKSVELAKFRLDDADLKSPVAGTVIVDGGIRPGLNITPGSYPFTILDNNTFRLVADVDWDDLPLFTPGNSVTVKLSDRKEEASGIILPLIPSPAAKKSPPQIHVRLSGIPGLLPGLPGEISHT